MGPGRFEESSFSPRHRSASSFDVVVAGGGPAGLASALALRRLGYSVCVLEPSELDESRVGEHLSARGLEYLDELGAGRISSELEYLPSPGIISFWGNAEALELPAFFRPEGAGVHVARPAFERTLGRVLVEVGGALHLATRFVSAARTDEGFSVLTRGPGGDTALAARILVDATGRAAALARRLGQRAVRRDRLVALVARTERRAQCTPMVEASQNGWWYSASLPCGRLQVVHFMDADLLARRSLRGSWRAGLGEAPNTAARLGSAGAQLEPRGTSAHTQALAGVVPGVIAAGDAALARDPLSSAGLTEALADGARVAQTVAATLAGDPTAIARHQAAVHQSLLTHLGQRAYFYGLVGRFAAEPFWRRRTLARAGALLARVLPGTLLHLAEQAPGAAWPLSALTPDVDWEALRAVSGKARPARCIAEDLRERYGYHDAEVVRLLQALVGAGVLLATSPVASAD